MNDTASFMAAFADFKIIRTRKTAQVVLEIPLEAADAALSALGGLPNPASERWVAVARLQEPAARDAPAAEAPAPADELDHPTGRRPFASLSAAKQAGIRCNDSSFREYLSHRSRKAGMPNEAMDMETAVAYVRGVCGVNSRAELDANPEARERWTKLQDAYWLWTRGYEDR